MEQPKNNLGFRLPVEPGYEHFFCSQGVGSRKILTGDDAVPTFDSIPTIDVSSIMSADLETRKRLAAQVDQAASEVGFFYFINPPVDYSNMDAAFDAIKKFFALPQQDKDNIHINKSPNAKGYEARFNDGVYKTNESFGFGVDYTNPEQEAMRGEHTSSIALNQWPDETLPEFRKALYAYWLEVRAFSKRLVGIFALALGLDEDGLDYLFEEPQTDITIQHYCVYPSTSFKPVLIPHTDYGAFTCLLQSEIGGLEVLNKNAIWVPVPVKEHAFVVNTGSHLEILSNGRWPATVHRVSGFGNIDRYSLPFFWSFDPSVTVKPLTQLGCPRYEAEHAGEEHIKGTFLPRPNHPTVKRLAERGLGLHTYDYVKLLHGEDPLEAA